MITQKDIRETDLYREAKNLHETQRQPGTGRISDATDIHAAPSGKQVVFAGSLVDTLNGSPPTRICLTDLASGDTHVLTFGPNIDRLPKYSPDGKQVAFLSDRQLAGNFQLYLLDPADGSVRAAPAVEGWVEYLHWSPDGKRILLGVAGHGADIAGGHGAVTSKKIGEPEPSWMPTIEAGTQSHHWRSAWVYELDLNNLRQVSGADINIWEAAWCGNDAIAAVTSPGPSEGLWYTSRLHILETKTASAKEIYSPQDQLGWPASSPSGKHLAIVEAVCSDRWIVAGDLRLIETASGASKRIDTHEIDIAYTEWRSDRHLLLGGHRGFETVVGLYDVASDTFRELWVSRDVTTAGRYIALSGFGDGGDCVLVGESFVRAPEIAAIRNSEYQTARSFDLGYAALVNSVIGAVEPVTWKARDGLDIQGWLLCPKGNAPYPLVLNVHGGPVGHYRPAWLGRWSVHHLMLLERGYALLFPNPRGSGGRGQAFARHVLGDMGGADTYDHLSGLDYLVAQGIADPKRLGVTGGSYGGFMTSWLVTQDTRFAAAVPVVPHTNHVTEHLLSNIPNFTALFLDDHYTDPNGKYFSRSPVMQAHKVRTPTLNICGALDRCTPAEEAAQFHNALLENGVKSVLVTYPEEGHGVRKWPAAFDFSARLVDWFEEHMPATGHDV